jgi:lysozyme
MPENNKYLKTAEWEGFKPTVYLDTKNKKTIGHGFNLDDPTIKTYLTKKGYNYKALVAGQQALSKEHSNSILKDLYNESYKSAGKIIKNFKTLPENVQDVLTDLNYNLGTTKMQKFSKMISAIEKQDFKTAAEELKNSNYYTQTGRRAKSHYETLSSVKPAPVAKPVSPTSFEPSWGDIVKTYLTNPMVPQFAGALLYNKLFDSNTSETPEKQASGGLIKRADGSYSQRGLWDNIRDNIGSGKEPTAEMLRQEKKISKEKNGGWLDSYEDGSWVADSSIPTPTSPNFYPDYTNPTLTNYQMGTPKSNLPIRGLRDATPEIPAYGYGGDVPQDSLYNMQRALQLGYKPDEKGHWPSVDHETGEWLKAKKHPTAWMEYLYGYTLDPELNKNTNVIQNQKGNLQYIPKKYAAGSTVWTKQDTPTWAAGTPTPTATQNFKNTNSINTSRYRIGDVIPTGMDYKTPAAGTKDYSRVMTSYDWNNQRRLHAPDTTIMRGGGNVEENVPGLRYQQLNPGVSEPLGVYTGPTTQRGITFADGGPTGENTVTSADSAALYNNTQALLNYFSTKNKYKNTGSGTTFNSNIHSINSEAVKQMIEDLKNPKTHPYTAERWNSGLTTAGNLLSGFTGIGSVETDQLDPDYDFELKDYYQNVDKNKYKQRELANNIIDTNAPMALYDRRIKPTIAYEFQNQNDEYTAINGTNPLFGDIVNFYGYDPNLIKPWHLLTAAEKTKRQQLLNSNNTQAITNTTITSNTRPNTPTVRTTTSIARPVTPLHPIYPKINPMPMRGLTSTIEDVQPQYVDVPKLPVSNMYMDMRGEWSDKPPVPSMSNNMTQAELEKRGYRVPKKAEGGWINSYDGGSYVSDSRDFLKGWYNSPKYKEMLAASVSNEKNPTKAFKIIDEDRRYGLDTPVKSINNLRSKAGAFGLNDASIGQVLVDRQFIEQNPNLASSLVSHELSHNSIMPKSDIAKIQSYTPKYDPKIHSTPGMVNDPRENYDAMTEPEEVRSMIYGLRNLAQKNNIYNTFTQPATKESLEKLSPLFQETEGGKSYDQLKRLKTYFTDEQIIDMMNTISENKNTTQNPPMAKNGGWLDSYEDGSLVEGNDPQQQAVQRAAGTTPYLNPAMVQATLARANQPTVNTLGQVVSTPASREKERREKVIAKDPSKYSIEDYKRGIQEPGLEDATLEAIDALSMLSGAGYLGKKGVELGVKEIGKGVKNLIYKGVDPMFYNPTEKIKSFVPNILGTEKDKIKRIEKIMRDSGVRGSYRKAHNRLDAWRVGLGLPQKYNTFKKTGENTFAINPEFFRLEPNVQQSIIAHVKAFNLKDKYLNNVITSEQYEKGLVNINKKMHNRLGDTFLGKYVKEENIPFLPEAIVERKGDKGFSMYDQDRYAGVMGGFRWDVEDLPDNKMKLIARDTWDLYPFDKRGVTKFSDLASLERQKNLNKGYIPALKNVEMLRLVGGKPYNIENTFIVDKYKQGGWLDNL